MIGGESDTDSFEQEDSKNYNSADSYVDDCHTDNCTVTMFVDPPTKGMSKSARNRYYAQTSRTRHRQYVTNLEKDREMLMERLEKIEEENKRMRDEILEWRISNKRIKPNDSNMMIHGEDNDEHSNTDPHSPNSEFQTPVDDIYAPNIYNSFITNYNNFDYVTSATTSPFRSINSNSNLNTITNNYALSVLDFLFLPCFPNQKQLVSSINSPRQLNPLKFKAPPQNFLVDSNEIEWKDQMNWRNNCWKVLKKEGAGNYFASRKLKSQRNRLILLRLVKLAKLKIYLQQFGNII